MANPLLLPHTEPGTTVHRSASAPAPQHGWLVGPEFDLLAFANIAWPVWVAVMLLSDGFAGVAGLQFWQIYFVTTPHRWITLPAVFLDRPRFRAQPGVFLGAAALATAACCGVRFATGGLTCLLAVDYAWNAWHFAAQHHGVYRIYDRLADPHRTAGVRTEKIALRGVLLFVILRIAGGTWSYPDWETWLERLDWLAAAILVSWIARELFQLDGRAIGRRCYLVSLGLLYLSLLAAVHWQQPRWVLLLTTTSALFHAIEYLSLVGWMERRRLDAHGSDLGLMSWLVPQWGAALAIFAIVLGSAGWWLEHQFLETWLLVNVIVAFLHYTYDGLIWRRPRTAA